MNQQTEQALLIAIEALGDAQNMIGDGGNSIPNYFLKPINACKAALEQPTNMVTVPLDKLEDMQRRLKALDSCTYKPKPANDYETLLKQFNSLLNLTNSLEGQLEYYRQQDYNLAKHRLDALEKSLESEKEMNAKLTNELDALDHMANNAREFGLEYDEQEPVDVARVQEDGYVEWNLDLPDLPVGTKLYTHPAQPLSDDDKWYGNRNWE